MSSRAPSTLHPFSRRSVGLRATVIAVGNEVAKSLIHAWSERLQILIELPLFIVAFLFFALFVGRGDQIASGRLEWSLDPTRVSWMFVGYAVWIFFYLQTAKLFWRLLGEIQAGTLEQVYLSPLPTWLVATAGRVLATVVETLGVVAALYVVVYIIVPFHLTWRALAGFPLIFILAGSIGYSLIVGGLTLMWKRVELLNDLVISVMVILSGALVPPSTTCPPGWRTSAGSHRSATESSPSGPSCWTAERPCRWEETAGCSGCSQPAPPTCSPESRCSASLTLWPGARDHSVAIDQGR